MPAQDLAQMLVYAQEGNIDAFMSRLAGRKYQDLGDNDNRILLNAVNNNHIDFLKEILKIHKSERQYTRENTDFIDSAFKNDKIEIIKELIKNNKIKGFILRALDRLLVSSAYVPDSHVLNYFFENYEDYCGKSSYNPGVFSKNLTQVACKTHNLKLISILEKKGYLGPLTDKLMKLLCFHTDGNLAIELPRVLDMPDLYEFLSIQPNTQEQMLKYSLELVKNLSTLAKEYNDPNKYFDKLSEDPNKLKIYVNIFTSLVLKPTLNDMEKDALSSLLKKKPINDACLKYDRLLFKILATKDKIVYKNYISNTYVDGLFTLKLETLRDAIAVKNVHFILELLNNPSTSNMTTELLESNKALIFAIIAFASNKSINCLLKINKLKDLILKNDNRLDLINATLKNGDLNIFKQLNNPLKVEANLAAVSNILNCLGRQPIKLDRLNILMHIIETYSQELSNPNFSQDSITISHVDFNLRIVYELLNLNHRLNIPDDGFELIVRRLIHNLPQVRNQASRDSNKLFRKALELNNERVVAILLEIPEVLESTVHNQHLYNPNTSTSYNLLARQRESSMVKLDENEENCLKNLAKHYDMTLKNDPKQNAIIKDLMQFCESMYKSEPAKIMVDAQMGRELELPFTWAEFEQLSNDLSLLNLKQEALIQYYKNIYHGAHRYLSTPNRWMHRRANHVIDDFDDTNNTLVSSANCQQHLSMIALFWLAASDINEPEMDGFNTELRQKHFIRELAYINRAHNWDKIRRISPTKSEEYDDLEGDKPSCVGGVKRRLFQSVSCHSRIQLVTDEHLFAELREFVRKYYNDLIINLDTTEFRSFHTALFDETHGYIMLGISMLENLKVDLNIPKDKLISALIKRFGSMSSAKLQLFVNNYFKSSTTRNADFDLLCYPCSLNTIISDRYNFLGLGEDQTCDETKPNNMLVAFSSHSRRQRSDYSDTEENVDSSSKRVRAVSALSLS